MTDLNTKMQILHDLYVDTYEESSEMWRWILDHDLGVPLSVCVVQGLATATPAGVAWIVSDYDDLCEYLEVDRHGDYNSLDELLEMAAG